MGYKLSPNITCPNPTEAATENIGKDLELLRNILSVKHGTP